MYHKPLLERGPALTFPRLCTSRHLGDLQWLASLTIILGILLTGIGVITLTNPQIWGHGITKISPELVTAFLGAELGALSFLYQTASRRIGTVDLFASEISVLCRIFAVADFATSSVERAAALQPAGNAHAMTVTAEVAKANRPPKAPKFSSEEQYTPAYDNHLAELAPLDADVITHVTEFYFYRKVMVDCLRALPNTPPTAADRLMLQMVYMQFLMYESARLAVDDLIEFEPRQSEVLVIILCSEMVVFGFLYNQFGRDYRAQRLHLRRDDYRDIVIDLLESIRQRGMHPLWLKARTTGAELLWRYLVMCQDTGMDSRVPLELAQAFPREPPVTAPAPTRDHLLRALASRWLTYAKFCRDLRLFGRRQVDSAQGAG